MRNMSIVTSTGASGQNPMSLPEIMPTIAYIRVTKHRDGLTFDRDVCKDDAKVVIECKITLSASVSYSLWHS